MNKINKHIEIVRSDIKALSSMGEKSCLMIFELLKKHYVSVGISTVNDVSSLEDLVAKRPDLVFLGVKYVPVKDTYENGQNNRIWVSGYLESNGINYTGSTNPAIALDFDKAAAKLVVSAAGINTPLFFTTRVGQFSSESDLPLKFPLFIKPPNTGGGKGIGADSVVRDYAGFCAKVESIDNNYNSQSLVETYLTGREFSVAILGGKTPEELIVMPVELLTPKNKNGDRILSKKVKREDAEKIIPIIDPVIYESIEAVAIRIFNALGARDYGRIDLRFDNFGVPHFLEANLIPGLAFHDFTSYFTSACMINRKMDYQSMILHIVNLGLTRGTTRPLPTTYAPQILDDTEIISLDANLVPAY